MKTRVLASDMKSSFGVAPDIIAPHGETYTPEVDNKYAPSRNPGSMSLENIPMTPINTQSNSSRSEAFWAKVKGSAFHKQYEEAKRKY